MMVVLERELWWNVTKTFDPTKPITDRAPNEVVENVFQRSARRQAKAIFFNKHVARRRPISEYRMAESLKFGSRFGKTVQDLVNACETDPKQFFPNIDDLLRRFGHVVQKPVAKESDHDMDAGDDEFSVGSGPEGEGSEGDASMNDENDEVAAGDGVTPETTRGFVLSKQELMNMVCTDEDEYRADKTGYRKQTNDMVVDVEPAGVAAEKARHV